MARNSPASCSRPRSPETARIVALGIGVNVAASPPRPALPRDLSRRTGLRGERRGDARGPVRELGRVREHLGEGPRHGAASASSGSTPRSVSANRLPSASARKRRAAPSRPSTKPASSSCAPLMARGRSPPAKSTSAKPPPPGSWPRCRSRGGPSSPAREARGGEVRLGRGWGVFPEALRRLLCAGVEGRSGPTAARSPSLSQAAQRPPTPTPPRHSALPSRERETPPLPARACRRGSAPPPQGRGSLTHERARLRSPRRSRRDRHERRALRLRAAASGANGSWSIAASALPARRGCRAST